jgi:hypothetical protein
VGERSHQKLQAKVELGVVHLPLGSMIGACIDGAESDEADSEFSSMYVRWFPLANPTDSVRVEGDGGLSTRPCDSEQKSDNLFEEYFAPCIHLALSWTPDRVEDTGFDSTDEHNSTSSETKSRKSDTPDISAKSVFPATAKSYFNADIGRFSFALIDSQRAFEVMSFYVVDTDLRYLETSKKTRIGLTVGWLQVDYQGNNAREPVVLAPTPTDGMAPVLQTIILKDNDQTHKDVVSYEFIDMSIAEFDFTLEEALLFDIVGYFSSIRHKKAVNTGVNARRNATSSNDNERRDSTTEPSMFSYLIDQNFREKSEGRMKVYIKQLYLSMVKVNVSYLKGKKLPSELAGHKGLNAVLHFPGTEYIMQQMMFHNQNSDVFLSWSQHTSDAENPDGDGKKDLDCTSMYFRFFLLSLNILHIAVTTSANRPQHAEFPGIVRNSFSKCL